jgi:hypothetical protein
MDGYLSMSLAEPLTPGISLARKIGGEINAII